jgi:hypothetical protein
VRNTARIALAYVIVGVWILGYLLAYFVDPAYGELAKGAMPIVAIAASALLGTEALKIVKGGKSDEPK